MTTFSRADLEGAEFLHTTLRGARFVESDLSGVVMRGVEVAQVDIDSPWLFEGGYLRVNGIDVVPLVDAELNRRFPGRAERRAESPDDLRTAWASVEQAWSAALDRAAAMPTGTVDVQVDGEWSFAQTLRHLVMATDIWLRKTILGVEQPYHPIGQIGAFAEDEGFDMSVLTHPDPSYDEVLEVRADHVAQVRDFIAAVTADELDAPRRNPWSPDHPETVRSCLHTILEEEWEHLRFAVRDLDAIEAQPSAG